MGSLSSTDPRFVSSRCRWDAMSKVKGKKAFAGESKGFYKNGGEVERKSKRESICYGNGKPGTPSKDVSDSQSGVGSSVGLQSVPYMGTDQNHFLSPVSLDGGALKGGTIVQLS